MIKHTLIPSICILLICGVAVGGDLSPYNITAGTATIDGDASDWTSATWQVNTLQYGYWDNSIAGWSPGTNVGAGNEDIDYTTTKWAARWQPNDPVAGTPGRIYAIAVIDDSHHSFQDAFTEWCASDRLEWFVHGPNNSGTATYHQDFIDAQQYVMSPKLSDNSQACNMCGYKHGTAEENGLDLEYAVSVSGDLVTYEASFPVYDSWEGFAGTGTTVNADMLPGVEVGLDLLVGSNIAPGFAGGGWPGYSVNYYLIDETGEANSPAFTQHKADGSSEVMLEHTLVAVKGDYDMDGDVDVSDLGILATNYGGSGLTWREGDSSGDTIVNVVDLGDLATNYGYGTAAAAAVPEPATLGLLLGALSIVCLFRRR